MSDPAIQRVIDESAIHEVLYRYCRGVDRCDIELVKSVYWPDAIDDHIFFTGSGIDFAETVVPMLHGLLEACQHMLGNIWMHIDDDVACGETYFQSNHRLCDGGGQAVAGGRYLDRLERRNGEWRIAERKVKIDWEQNCTSLLGGEENTKKLFAIDTRNRDDDSYLLFATGTMVRK